MEYEVVREIKNQCPNNQMRDIFFDEVDTEDPEDYVRQMLKGKSVELSSQTAENGAVTVHAVCDNITQVFIFTPL